MLRRRRACRPLVEAHPTAAPPQRDLPAFKLPNLQSPLDVSRLLLDVLLLAVGVRRTAFTVTAAVATLLGLLGVTIGLWRTLMTSAASVLTIFVGARAAPTGCLQCWQRRVEAATRARQPQLGAVHPAPSSRPPPALPAVQA